MGDISGVNQVEWNDLHGTRSHSPKIGQKRTQVIKYVSRWLLDIYLQVGRYNGSDDFSGFLAYGEAMVVLSLLHCLQCIVTSGARSAERSSFLNASILTS